MQKVRCYSLYSHFADLMLFVMLCLAAFFPVVCFKDDSTVLQIVWISVMSISALFSLFIFFYRVQYLLIEDNKFILKNCFTKIKELNIDDCYYEISSLPSYYGRGVIYKKWICIYLRHKRRKKFESGFSNSKKYDRIQIVYTEQNLDFIKRYIKTFKETK